MTSLMQTEYISLPPTFVASLGWLLIIGYFYVLVSTYLLICHLSVVFNDFGPEFEVIDATGENPLHGMIAAISKEADAIVTCLDETRHGLEDDTYVTFSEIKGMVELNGCEPKQVKVLGMFKL